MVIDQDAMAKFKRKKYLIEEHFYVKGRFKLYVLGSVQAS